MNLDRCKEEMNVYGFTTLGQLLDQELVDFFRKDLLERKAKQISAHGISKIIKYGELEFLRNCAAYHANYIKLIEAKWLNDFINATLNDKAIIHGYHGILTSSESKDIQTVDKFSPMRFHRDIPWFKDMRTCVLILMPLVDFTMVNGPTEYVPSTHLFENRPSEEFMTAHAKQMLGPAGSVFAMDAATYHRAGLNNSGLPRPMLQMNWTLAFFKQQIDPWQDNSLVDVSDIAKARLGFNVRTYQNPDEMLQEDRKWKSGNYDVSNTYIR